MRTLNFGIVFMIAACTTKNEFKAERIQRSESFIVNGPIEEVFPLFGPVKEKLWECGWNPEILYSITNDVEEYMVFETASSHGEDESYRWIITKYDPLQYLIEYTVSTSQRVWFITVKCSAVEASTNVRVTYSYTGLTEQGNELNKQALEKMYAKNLRDWQEAINYYLENGTAKR